MISSSPLKLHNIEYRTSPFYTNKVSKFEYQAVQFAKGWRYHNQNLLRKSPGLHTIEVKMVGFIWRLASVSLSWIWSFTFFEVRSVLKIEYPRYIGLSWVSWLFGQKFEGETSENCIKSGHLENIVRFANRTKSRTALIKSTLSRDLLYTYVHI